MQALPVVIQLKVGCLGTEVYQSVWLWNNSKYRKSMMTSSEVCHVPSQSSGDWWTDAAKFQDEGCFQNEGEWELLSLPGELKDGDSKVSSLEKWWNTMIKAESMQDVEALPMESLQGSRQVWGSGNHRDWFQLFKWCILLPRGHINTELETANVSSPHICQILDGSLGGRGIPPAVKSIALKFFMLSCLHPGDLILWRENWFQNACRIVYLYANIILQSVTSLGRPLELHGKVFIKNRTVCNLGCREESPGDC